MESPNTLILTNNHSGQVALWTATALFAICPPTFIWLGLKVHPKKRTFHYINTFITIISVLDYYRMASGEGHRPLFQGIETIDGDSRAIYRDVYYQHYANWSLCTPVTMFQTALLSGMSWKDIAIFVFANEALIQTGWVAALNEDFTRKFVWWGFSIIALLYIIYSMFAIGGKAATLQHPRVAFLYYIVIGGGVFLMVAYPINFLLGEGFGLVSVGTEQIIYSILDILVRIPLGFMLIFVDKLTDNHFHLGDLPEIVVEERSNEKAGRVYLE